MKSWRIILFVLFLTCLQCGCASVWHDLQPHRLRRLNRGAAPSFNPDFSRLNKPARNQLARFEEPRPAEMTANSADVTLARGQNP